MLGISNLELFGLPRRMLVDVGDEELVALGEEGCAALRMCIAVLARNGAVPVVSVVHGFVIVRESEIGGWLAGPRTSKRDGEFLLVEDEELNTSYIGWPRTPCYVHRLP